ncbi:hypothetical protein SAY86_004977 [Trapa natans]|uniref:Uncharacterized protein n=1 Tax=Trapa natans TaxID=22666 RepID=A0AAN7L204_TRANT|nr:hypothetical protein SAY86_004977 [Trapa natans]
MRAHQMEKNGINNAPKSCLVKENKIEEQTPAFGINGLLLLWKITNIFENGVQCREVLDAIIDRCSALQNIRQAVLQYRKVFNQQHVEPRVRQLALNCGAEYLDRYFRLMAFAAYLGSEAFDGLCGQGLTKMSFKSWLHQRPELQAMKWSVRLWPGRFFTVSEELRVPEESQHGNAVMEAIVTTRNGSVFGKGSILKMYSSWVRELAVDDDFPVFSMATPTISGAKEMLAYLGANPKDGAKSRKVVITDIREETVVYINGTSFVLRELNKPVETLKHMGITGPAVEHLDGRMDLELVYEDQGFSSAAVQGNHSDNAIDSDD